MDNNLNKTTTTAAVKLTLAYEDTDFTRDVKFENMKIADLGNVKQRVFDFNVMQMAIPNDLTEGHTLTADENTKNLYVADKWKNLENLTPYKISQISAATIIATTTTPLVVNGRVA